MASPHNSPPRDTKKTGMAAGLSHLRAELIRGQSAPLAPDGTNSLVAITPTVVIAVATLIIPAAIPVTTALVIYADTRPARHNNDGTASVRTAIWPALSIRATVEPRAAALSSNGGR